MNKRALIIGAGTYGEVYASYLNEAGYEVVGFLDDDLSKHGNKYTGIEVIGSIRELKEIGLFKNVSSVFCPLGNNRLRVKFLQYAAELGFETPNYIHPSVNLAPNLKIGEKGIYILPHTVIMPYVTISNYCMISVNSVVSHHSYLKEGVFLSFGVNVGASLILEKYTYVGIGATIMTGVKSLGENCLIGAGAVVIKDVPNNAIMAGVPAKVLKFKDTTKPLDKE